MLPLPSNSTGNQCPCWSCTKNIPWDETDEFQIYRIWTDLSSCWSDIHISRSFLDHRRCIQAISPNFCDALGLSHQLHWRTDRHTVSCSGTISLQRLRSHQEEQPVCETITTSEWQAFAVLQDTASLHKKQRKKVWLNAMHPRIYLVHSTIAALAYLVLYTERTCRFL